MATKPTLSCRDRYEKEFIDELAKAGTSLYKAFVDAIRAYAIALHNAVIRETNPEEFQRGEEEYLSIVKKYKKEQADHLVNACTVIAKALNVNRRDFLGRMMEVVGTTQAGLGQCFTPAHMAELMAEITWKDEYKEMADRGEVLIINDPTCGGCVLPIEAAESFMRHGVPQSQIFVKVEDIENVAFNVSYIQLTLLGYAAVVTRQNTLTEEVYEGPWYTLGYYLHDMENRLRFKDMIHILQGLFAKGGIGDKPKESESADAPTSPTSQAESPEPSPPPDEPQTATVTQLELF